MKRGISLNAALIMIMAGILIIVLWALGKSFGILNSPVWVDMIPVFGGAATLAGIGIALGKMLQKIDRVLTDVEKIRDKTDDLTGRIIALEIRLS